MSRSWGQTLWVGHYHKNREKESPSSDDNRKQLLRVVPGDIWVKYKYKVDEQDKLVSKDSTERKSPSHIAIVAYVPLNAAELSVEDLMDQIILIEGEYTNKI